MTISSLAGISSEYLDIVGGTGGDNLNIYVIQVRMVW